MNTKKLVLTALTATLISGSPVLAQGMSEGARDRGQGAIASELKWRNAGHASAQAFLNANPDSAVGKLAALSEAAAAAAAAYEAAGVEEGTELRDPLLIIVDITLVEADIEALDTESETYEDDLAALLAELALLEAELVLPESLADLEAAEDVVGVDDLSEEALAVLWELLEK